MVRRDSKSTMDASIFDKLDKFDKFDEDDLLIIAIILHNKKSQKHRIKLVQETLKKRERYRNLEWWLPGHMHRY